MCPDIDNICLRGWRVKRAVERWRGVNFFTSHPLLTSLAITHPRDSASLGRL